jgi:hypothetical protein
MEYDEFHGIGGQYVADPKTGKRKLVQRTEERAEPVAPAVVDDTEIEAGE